ncbi:nuclear transport factor 2 family protein [Inhella sp.]|uniref:nuclear transport factor 2 family protein n=1 Tax=Inhella sp. TaxID=1921806 RepID=UPI0035ADF160
MPNHSLDELRDTVERMEDRLLEQPAGAPGYEALVARFAADLPNERDRRLAQSAALMVHQQQSVNASLATRFLEAYAAKDLDTIASLITPNVRLRDWNLAVSGREAFLAETRKNFEEAERIAIDLLHLHATAGSVAAEMRILVNEDIELTVVDVFDFDHQGRITAVRSYKGI